MLQSKLFTKTRKDAPKDEVSKNAELLIRAGFIHKEMAGVYSFLPLGERVLKNIVEVIRKEMNALGGEEVSLTALQDKKVWEKTGRWDDKVMDVWFKTKLKNETELGLAPTHEEPLTSIMKEYVNSYRDLPRYVYQFQTKFRNETRAKSGLARGREFLMKDLYSFSASEKSHTEFYEKVKDAYMRIFKAVGIGEQTYVTFASGGSFSKFSHEFQTVMETGEDIVYVDEAKKIAVNKEVMNDETLKELGLKKESLVEKKTIEVGNIFSLGTKFSDALELTFIDEAGKKMPVIMGSYGIGPSRLMATVVETLSDEKGIVWPESIAPFKVHIIELAQDKKEVHEEVMNLYKKLTDKGVTVLLDDRDMRAGEKFADSDLIGIPFRIVVSEKTIQAGGVEIKKRSEEKAKIVSNEELLKLILH
jgi:prolyl-tRNA synthetase